VERATVSDCNIQDNVLGDRRSKLAEASASELLHDPFFTAWKIWFQAVKGRVNVVVELCDVVHYADLGRALFEDHYGVYGSTFVCIGSRDRMWYRFIQMRKKKKGICE
jgi:hypothetical protein